MKLVYKFLLLFFLIVIPNYAQKDTIKLKEVQITSSRISLPFSKNSRTITLINLQEINRASAANLADLLQNYAGVDVRRRGINGMQSDLYIRGGNFDQTLLLIDGIKMDDAQTGHHTMNAILTLSAIERVEIIKGPAARIFGQNAFTGAINIVTKNSTNNALNLNLGYGAFNTKEISSNFTQKFNKANVLTALTYQKSDGYRFNTDFENIGSFLKAVNGNYQFISVFNQRKFGANGFYASPDYKDQYEETQTSLLALKTTCKFKNIVVKPHFYWRRNQDMYLFLRENPSYYRNLHITNKIGFETNVMLNSKYGKTGVGIDFSKVYLNSNNLGNHNRTVLTGFLEHRFELFNEKLSVTPGFAVSWYSDFNSTFFPGIDLGYNFSDKFLMYSNFGYTYRVPTFTDLFYVGPITNGNANLKPESAFSQEFGVKYLADSFNISLALFHRNSDNLIDWTKDKLEDKWKAKNFNNVTTKGIEIAINYNYLIGKYSQNLQIGYSFIDDTINDTSVQYTRYSINSLKHQLTTSINTTITSNFNQNIALRYVKRTDGESYTVLDAKAGFLLSKKLKLNVIASNIFNTEYTETNLVPMPKGNVMIGLNYIIY